MTRMPMDGQRLRAAQMLVIGNACWALSFPTMKAMTLLQQPLLPHSSSWFVTGLTLMFRFGLASLVMLFVCSRTLKNLTAFEIWQGSILGLFAGIGLVFQMDGLAYTEASTSAFLTQFYCLTIPVWVAWHSRRWPSLLTAVSCAMVVGGVAVLSHMEWRNLRMGRGELETLIASIIFTGQILWLQRPQFARNNVNHFTLVMFVVIALCGLPVAAASASPLDSWLVAYRSAPAWVFVMVLTVFCTLGGYCLMNYFQPVLTATQAGLLYCLEPVFASAFALFLPAWFSSMAGIQYANETLETSLLVGGGLITAANVLSVLGASTPEPGCNGDSARQKKPARKVPAATQREPVA